MKPGYYLRRFLEVGPKVGLHLVKHRIGLRRHQNNTQRWLEKYRGQEPSDESFFFDMGYRAPHHAEERAILVKQLDETLLERGWPTLQTEKTTQFIATFLPEEKRATLSRAESIIQGDYRWLWSGMPEMDSPPDWHQALGGETKSAWPLLPPSELDQSETPGDVRLTFEVARHQYLCTLARAWLHTREPRFAQTAMAHLLHWLDHNPFALGIHWWHPQEAALRIKSWLWTYGAILSCENIPDVDRLRIHKSLWQHMHFVLRTLSDSPITHNHLLIELFGAAHYTLAFPQFGVSRRWHSKLTRILDRELKKQFWKDGSPGEGSVNYHLFVLESAVEWLAHRNILDMRTPSDITDRIAAMTHFARSVLRPDGSWPKIGDADNGRGFRLSDDDTRMRLGSIDAACRLTGSPPPPCDYPSPESIWLLGCTDPDSLSNRKQDLETARVNWFETTGFHISDHDTSEASANHLTVAMGPSSLPPGVPLGHLHAHALSICWWVNGCEILTDPGTGFYNLCPEQRAVFRQTAAHTTIQIRDIDHFDVTSYRFGTGRVSPTRVLTCESGPGWSIIGATIPASADSPWNNIQLERHVVHLHHVPAVLLFDRWVGTTNGLFGEEGEQADSFLQWFQFGDVQVSIRPDERSASLSDASGTPVAELFIHGSSTRLEAIKPSRDPWGPGWRSKHYGVIEPGKTLRAAYTPTGDTTQSWSTIAPPGSSVDFRDEEIGFRQNGEVVCVVLLNPKGQPQSVRWNERQRETTEELSP